MPLPSEHLTMPQASIVRYGIHQQLQCELAELQEQDEKILCIEGAMERMAKFHPERANEVCHGDDVPGRARDVCETAVARGMYNMERDLSLYLQ